MKNLLIATVLILSLTGCAKHLIVKSNDGPTDFDAMGKILGCMFAPDTCPKKEKSEETLDEESDKEWDEVK